LKAQGLQPKAHSGEAQPTATHMSIVKLMQSGFLKYLISQNCDGLHIKSGIPPENISELHGSSCVEACANCGKVFYRNFSVRSTRNNMKLTGRRCTSCNTPLRYSSVAFGQSLPDLCLARAELHSEKSDLAICLGTSMTVSPACDLPVAGKQKNPSHSLCIVNLQHTPYDSQCAIRIYHKVDTVMSMLMGMLSLEIPNFNKLNLSQNQEWMTNFDKNYVFRSPSTEWFSGKLQQSDGVVLEYFTEKES